MEYQARRRSKIKSREIFKSRENAPFPSQGLLELVRERAVPIRKRRVEGLDVAQIAAYEESRPAEEGDRGFRVGEDSGGVVGLRRLGG